MSDWRFDILLALCGVSTVCSIISTVLLARGQRPDPNVPKEHPMPAYRARYVKVSILAADDPTQLREVDSIVFDLQKDKDQALQAKYKDVCNLVDSRLAREADEPSQ